MMEKVAEEKNSYDGHELRHQEGARNKVGELERRARELSSGQVEGLRYRGELRDEHIGRIRSRLSVPCMLELEVTEEATDGIRQIDVTVGGGID